MTTPTETLPDNHFPTVKHGLRIFRLRRSLELLERNYHELNEFLDTIKDPQTFINILNGDDPYKIDELILEVERRLINFVSMAKALVDTNRKLINEWYQDTEILAIYSNEITRRFSSNEIILFTHDLRNYVLHYGLPQVKARGSSVIKDDELILEAGYVLRKSTLLKWKGWNSRAKQFLENQEENIFIDDFVDQYHEIIASFYEWLIEELNK